LQNGHGGRAMQAVVRRSHFSSAEQGRDSLTITVVVSLGCSRWWFRGHCRVLFPTPTSWSWADTTFEARWAALTSTSQLTSPTPFPFRHLPSTPSFYCVSPSPGPVTARPLSGDHGLASSAGSLTAGSP